MDPVIRFRSAVALVGRFPVLAGVDLDVAQGEIVLLQGANGAGKTSLLRACAGLLRVASGEATVLGADLVADPRAVRRRVGLLGHATALYDDLSAAENVRFAVRAAGGPRRRGRPRPGPAGPRGPAGDHAGGGACPPASGGGWRWPRWWRATPSCGCSTNPTPALTPSTGTSSTSWSATLSGEARPWCWPPMSTIGPRPWPGGS